MVKSYMNSIPGLLRPAKHLPDKTRYGSKFTVEYGKKNGRFKNHTKNI